MGHWFFRQRMSSKDRDNEENKGESTDEVSVEKEAAESTGTESTEKDSAGEVDLEGLDDLLASSDSVPDEEDEDFNFKEALRSIHIDLNGLNEEAAELAARIARNFEELGA